jgi:carboxymethylenebutenolidase
MPLISFDAPAGSLPGYLAVPDGDGPRPGVVVVQDVFGMTEDLRAQTDRLAAHGYLALAPDLYGRGGRKFSCIRSAIGQLRARSGPAFEDIEAARALLAARTDCTGRIGVIGFCLGGGFALLTAARYDFDAASVNYGDVPEDEDLLAGVCPVVASFGGRDKPLLKHPARLEAALSRQDVPHDVKVYPEAGHAFMNNNSGRVYQVMKTLSSTTARIGYQPEAAADSWTRIFAFFDEHLRTSS